jgi:hypothetical protein
MEEDGTAPRILNLGIRGEWIVSPVPKRGRGGGGSRYKLLGPDGPEGDEGPDYIAYAFVFLGSIRCN